jgi:hypothetical protein
MPPVNDSTSEKLVVGEMHLIPALPQVEVQGKAAEEVEAATDPGNEDGATVREVVENREIEGGHMTLRSAGREEADSICAPQNTADRPGRAR